MRVQQRRLCVVFLQNVVVLLLILVVRGLDEVLDFLHGVRDDALWFVLGRVGFI